MTDGRDLAERQLRELAAVSDGAIEILGVQDGTTGRWFTISMDTSGITTTGAGIRVRDRERFRIFAGSGYPYRHPAVQVAHTRWARTPHVQWGHQLCLYAAPSVEWVPSDGMHGLVERLSTWVVRAAEGTLDPDGQPLHPPVAYATSWAGTLIVHPDVGDRAPWPSGDGAGTAGPCTPRAGSMVAWCTADGDRVDVLEWIDWPTAYRRVLQEGFDPFHGGRSVVVMPTLLIGDELGFEYPDKAWDLVSALKDNGFTLDDILNELANATLVNRFLRTSQRKTDPAADAHPVGIDAEDEDALTPLLTGLLVGTPSRRVDRARLTHFAAWALGGAGRLLAGAYADFRHKPAKQEMLEKVGAITQDWLRDADVRWMRVLEDRPEVTCRRDRATPSNWLIGRRVLILGCGALGAPAAEHCVRADVAALHLVDNGLVTPGILVRQPYDDADISQPKAKALAARLNTIRPQLRVEAHHGNAVDVVGQPDLDVGQFDLIIDATADAGVRAALENRRRADIATWPPLITVLVGHDATRGLVMISTPASTGAGVSALRAAALHALANPREWSDIADDFFPEEPRTDMFFPEPGCSAPTFVGGSVQTTALASLLFNEALLVLGPNSLSAAGPRTAAFASAVRIGPAANAQAISRAQFGPDTVAIDDGFGYEVRLSPAAKTEMRTEVRRGARVRGTHIETGGMLLGTIDDSAGVIFVDRVTGPPPDSFLSATYFQHGQEGAQQVVDAYRKASRRMTGFLGYWHTHPGGRAAPSPTDEEGMASVTTPDGRWQRALMIIAGGPAPDWERWLSGEGTVPALFARIVPRGGSQIGDAGAVFATHRPPEAPFFRGGFSRASLLSRTADGSVPSTRSSRFVWRGFWKRRRGECR